MLYRLKSLFGLGKSAHANLSASDCWKRFVTNAARVPYYSVGDQKKILSGLTTTAGLPELAPVELEDFYANVDRFRNPGGRSLSSVPLESPWAGSPRILALAPWFDLESRVRVSAHPCCEEIRKFKPEAIAGPVRVLRGLAIAMREGRLELPSLRFGIIAFTGIGQACLTPADRDLFWRSFQTPVFEQLRGFQGELLAAECDSHDGLHIKMTRAIWEQSDGRLLVTSLEDLRHPVLRLASGFSGVIDRRRCPCGRTEPRLAQLTSDCPPAAPNLAEPDPELQPAPV